MITNNQLMLNVINGLKTIEKQFNDKLNNLETSLELQINFLENKINNLILNGKLKGEKVIVENLV